MTTLPNDIDEIIRQARIVTDRITIREGTANVPIQAFEYTTNRWEEVTMANISTNNTATAVINATNPTNPRPIPIQVTVRRDGYTWAIFVSINNGQVDLPPIDTIKALLPPAHKHYLGGRHSRRRSAIFYLRSALDRGLPTAVLHDALKAWAFSYASNNEPAESISNYTPQNEDDAFLLRAQPATIVVGGHAYKLVPTGERDISSMLKHVRNKAKAIADVEISAKRDRATNDSRILIAEAIQRANVIRAEVEQLRASLGNQAPEWARNSGRPIRKSGNNWQIGLNVITYIEDIRYRVERWRSTIHWTPTHPHNPDYYNYHPMDMWLTLNPEGAYTMYDIRADDWFTVHTTNERGCMTLQALPPRINNPTDLVNLERGLSRGMRVVNLNSPLWTDINRMYPLFVEQLPFSVKEWLAGRMTIDPGTGVTPVDYLAHLNRGRGAGSQVSWDRVESDVQEAEYTFTVPANTATNAPVRIEE